MVRQTQASLVATGIVTLTSDCDMIDNENGMLVVTLNHLAEERAEDLRWVSISM